MYRKPYWYRDKETYTETFTIRSQPISNTVHFVSNFILNLVISYPVWYFRTSDISCKNNNNNKKKKKKKKKKKTTKKQQQKNKQKKQKKHKQQKKQTEKNKQTNNNNKTFWSFCN